MDEILNYTRDWLLQDQYEFGEFGQHEIVNPTDLPRTYELSLMKPNVFSSIYAYYALVSTGSVPTKTITEFQKWVASIRNADGYWTSASGAPMPVGNRGGWARNKNLRHTAKCLDYYFLCNMFFYQDAEVFCKIILNQLECGAYPQFVGGQPDIWSTAYFVNLLIRASADCYLRLTCPREKEVLSWKNELTNRLDRAIDWLISQIRLENKLWYIEGGNPVSISIAMMVEIGGYLAIHRSEQCKEIVGTLLKTIDYNYSLLYIACLTLDTLNSKEQKTIIEAVKKSMACFDKNKPLIDLIEAVSLCKLAFNIESIGAIQYRRNISNGHESLLISGSTWDNNEYFLWCINSFTMNNVIHTPNPIQECDFWEQIKQYILIIKKGIENSRRWELLWNGDSPRDEKAVQIYFDNQLRIICEHASASFSREPETGRGPIDFTFSNGFNHKDLIEIKLATNQALSNGNFCVQIYEYLKGLNNPTAFLVVVGYYEKNKDVMSRVEEHILNFNEAHPSHFIYPIYIDAQKKGGASKASFDNTKS